MEKRKTILLFSDLEGTIFSEVDGEYSNEDMNQFLSQIDKLQDLSNAKVRIHLVSPVYAKQMEMIMDKIDKSIIKYNRQHRESGEILEVQGGIAYPETEMLSQAFCGNRITLLKRPINKKDFDVARYGKEKYVKQWCEVYDESESEKLIMAIYCGNGLNDVRAVDYINSLRQGIVVCPNNATSELKSKAFHVSDKSELKGVSEGIQKINEEIEKRKKSVEDTEQKFKRDPGGVEL